MTSGNPQRSQGQRALDALAVDFLHLPGVDRSTMFGSNGLLTYGKIFAFVGVTGELVVKVPADRASELVADGGATRVRIGRNPAREWIGVAAQVAHEYDRADPEIIWQTLAVELPRVTAQVASILDDPAGQPETHREVS